MITHMVDMRKTNCSRRTIFLGWQVHYYHKARN